MLFNATEVKFKYKIIYIVRCYSTGINLPWLLTFFVHIIDYGLYLFRLVYIKLNIFAKYI